MTTELDTRLDDLLGSLSDPPAEKKSRRLKPPEIPEPVYKKTPSRNTKKRLKPLEETAQKGESEFAPHPLFSEAHPGLHKLNRFMLPRLILIAIAGWMVYWVFSNLLTGNFMFAYEFFRHNWFIQGAITLITTEGAFKEWFSLYGPLIVVLIMTVTFALVIVHRFIWRWIFRDYVRFTEGVETLEGRAYWVEGAGAWFNLWDNWYKGHIEKKALKRYLQRCEAFARERGFKGERLGIYLTKMRARALERFKETPIYDPVGLRKVITIYINYKKRPPNPFNPGRSLLKNRLNPAIEKIVRRGAYELVVHEGLYRKITGVREFVTHSEAYQSSKIQVKYANAVFGKRVIDLIHDTNRLSKANVKVRLDKLRSGTVLVDPEIREMIIDERRQAKV